MTLKNDLIKNTEAAKKQYDAKVVKLIRLKYSANEEAAILRKKLAGLDTAGEFEAFNDYAEACKIKVKADLGL